MIPYDDLVAALSAWRARQGLPVSTMGGPAASSGSGPHASTLDEPLQVDDAELVDEQYDDGYGGEATALGGAPDRPTDPNDFGSGRGGSGRGW